MASLTQILQEGIRAQAGKDIPVIIPRGMSADRYQASLFEDLSRKGLATQLTQREVFGNEQILPEQIIGLLADNQGPSRYTVLVRQGGVLYMTPISSCYTLNGNNVFTRR